MPSPRDIMRAANISRGVDSLGMMPIKSGLNFLGKQLGRLGLRDASKSTKIGDDLIRNYVSKPGEAISHHVGSALGEMPVVGNLFKYKLRPDDIAEAAKGGLSFSNKNFKELSAQSNLGKLHTYRAAAPFESKGMYTVVMPMLAGSYVQDAMNKEKTPDEIEADNRSRENLGIFKRLMNKKNGGESVMNNSIEKNAQSRMMIEAADALDGLTIELRDEKRQHLDALRELSLYKKASKLVDMGSMDYTDTESFVKEGMSKVSTSMSPPPSPLTQPVNERNPEPSSNLASLFTETQGSLPSSASIPKHAESIGSLHDPHTGRKRNGMIYQNGQSAFQQMNDFVNS